jgi:hypothetical protein
MYEQAIAYDWLPGGPGTTGQTWANTDPQRRFRYIGYEYDGGSLSFTGKVEYVDGSYVRTDSTNTWYGSINDFSGNWTPGAPNIGQVMPNAPTPGGANVLITSILNSLHGLQNGVRTSMYLVKIRKNESTNIVYTADNWYRLYSIKENGTERLPLIPTNNYTLYINNIQSNTSVNVTINARKDVQDEGATQDILDWLQGFDDVPLAPTYLNVLYAPTKLTLRERFWINANPTVTNVFTLKVHPDGIHKRPLYQTLEMAVNSNKVERLQGDAVVKAMAAYSLSSPTNWVMTSQFSLRNDSFDANNKSRAFINEFPDQPAFFKWSLEVKDPRSATQELINVPKP